MTTNVADRAVIGFIRDYTDEELGEPRLCQILDGGVRTSKPVGVRIQREIHRVLFSRDRGQARGGP